MTASFDLLGHDITVAEIHRNLSVGALYEHAVRYEKDASIVENGALAAYSGVKTGRSPKDKRVVKHEDSEAAVWWGQVNIPIEPHIFALNRERARDYLNTRERLYCVDGFAGWDPKYRLNVRVICSRPYHALFMRTMLIRPTKEELAEFGLPDLVIYNAGAFPANRLTASMDSKTSIDLSLENQELVILGTEYAGEMKSESLRSQTTLRPNAAFYRCIARRPQTNSPIAPRCSLVCRARARPRSPRTPRGT
jgi:phosphoenolpyruvate carboxykinase (ATP)